VIGAGMHACVGVCRCACMCGCVQGCMHVCVCAGVHACVQVCVCVTLGFELRASHLQSRHCIAGATPPVHFALVILERVVLQTICLDWPPTAILLTSASQVARITDVSHQHLALVVFSCLFFVFVISKAE
jgi:hypothetical protein